MTRNRYFFVKSILNIISLLDTKSRRRYQAFIFLRVIINLLDVLALAMVAVFGGFLALGARAEEFKILGMQFQVESSQSLIAIAAIIAGIFILKSLVALFVYRAMSRFLAGVETALAMQIWSSFATGTLANLKSQSRADLTWLVHSSPNLAANQILSAVANFAAESGLLVLTFVFLFLLSPGIAVAMLVYFVLILLLFQRFIGTTLRSLGKRISSSSIGTMNEINSFADNFREVLVYGASDAFTQRLFRQRSVFSTETARRSFYTALPRYLVETALVSSLVILAIWQLADSRSEQGFAVTAVVLTGGVRMMAAVLPLQTSISHLRTLVPQVSTLVTKYRDYAGSFRGANEPRKDSRASEESKVLGSGIRVSCQAVSFSHDTGDSAGIQGITIDVSPGEHVGIVGPSGSGKTTLVDLLLGVNSPQSGEVLINGLPPRNFVSLFPGRIAYVPQAPGLTPGSVISNVAFGVEPGKIDRRRAIAALLDVGLSDFVEGLPIGVDSDLGRQADKLSGGQRQRIGLARALYSNPKLIVLDEVTSALDSGAESEIVDLLKKLRGIVTVVVVAHRVSTLRHVDRVLLIEDGRLSAEGSFDDVLGKPGRAIEGEI